MNPFIELHVEPVLFDTYQSVSIYMFSNSLTLLVCASPQR